MGLFKNGVGRPSNEILEKRRRFYIIIVFILVALVGAGVFYTMNYFKNNKISGNNSNAIVGGGVGSTYYLLDCRGGDGKRDNYDLDALRRIVKDSSYKKIIKTIKNADVNDDGLISQKDVNMFSRLLTKVSGYYIGDVDKSGNIEASDSRLILRYAVSIEKPDSLRTKLADIDGDGKITSNDSRLALKLSTGLGDICHLYSDKKVQVQSTYPHPVIDQNSSKFDGEYGVTKNYEINSLKDAGCGPNSLATIISGIYGVTVTGVDVADAAKKYYVGNVDVASILKNKDKNKKAFNDFLNKLDDYYTIGSGSAYPGIFDNKFLQQTFGVKSENITSSNFSTAQSYLDNGKAVIMSIKMGNYGHILALLPISAKKKVEGYKFYVYDSISSTSGGSGFYKSFDEFKNTVKYRAGRVTSFTVRYAIYK